MPNDVLLFEELDRTQVAVAGGKGAQLAELSRVDGVRVPAGFVVTTHAFQRVLLQVPIDSRLSALKPDDRDAIRTLSAELRRAIEQVKIPDELAAAVTRALALLGFEAAYAVRSSATAEDLPTVSFAGQQDSYLDVRGVPAILQHVSRCWASLFTERAVTYRLRNGFDHRQVQMAVVVQQMVFPQAAGVLFTADPMTGNRKVACVEAAFGLAEALVSGRVNADVFKVRDGALVSKTLATQAPALTDAQAVELVQVGRRIEAHFGCPQDIEWCLTGRGFHFVQSRPITTLFPIPAAADGENHVYLSVGHQQMMTDALKPLAISFWQLTAARPMHEAGGRLFVDVTADLASPAKRAALMGMAGKSDPLTRDALETILARGDFIRTVPDAAPAPAGPPQGAGPAPDPAIVPELIARWQGSLAALKRDVQAKSGPALLDFIFADVQELKRLLFDPKNFQAIMAGIQATWWLNDQLQAWLGEKNVADALTQSAPGNVTSQMGLALLDVADVVRRHPQVVAALQRSGSLDGLTALPGGAESRAAVDAWLEKYGMRCIGEIDLARPRWSERPSMLVPLILCNVKSFEPGESERRFEQGLREAAKKEDDVLQRLRALPDGAQKAEEAKQMIDRVRAFIGYREYPKYAWMCRYFVYKQALLADAKGNEDVFFLTFQELRANRFDDALIRRRKDAFSAHQALSPPRVLTSEGEGLSGAYRRDDAPAGALMGLAVSGGTVEGRARVVLDPANAVLEPGDILVTAFTDPSWTPAFVGIKALVTEVGGLMTHGAVIAREYGLPAVVGVERATHRIRDGQRVRVNGTDGYVELLSGVHA
jgi:phosphoenolpyruvate synthase/pyruvate phosphate dikinase